MNVSISIVIPNFNGEKYLKIALDSIIENLIASNYSFEIVLVDNNSTDDSLIIVNSIKRKSSCSIRLIHLEKNYGFSYAVNVGIYQSKGAYILLLNNDIELGSSVIKPLMKLLLSDTKVFSCSSKMLRYYDRDKIDDAGDLYTLLGWTLKRGDGQLINEYIADGEIFSSCAGAAIYRKSILDKIGYFDENFFAYMEDVDIGYRAKIHGYKNMYCSDAIVYHIGSATSGSRYNSFKVKLAARNNVYVVYKNMPFLQLLINSPFLFIGFTVKYLFFSKLGFGKEYREGIFEAFRNLKNIEKVKYSNKNLFNYVKIEIELIANTFKFFFDKAGRLIGRLRG